MAIHHTSPRQPFHFLLFTFNFPKGLLFTFRSSLFTSRRDTFHFCHAVRCVGSRSVLHWLLQRAALGIAAHCVFQPIIIRVPAQHFLLFTFHPSLPARTTFHFSLFTLHLYHAPHCVSQPIIIRVPAQHFSRFLRAFSCECRRRMAGASYGAQPVILLSFLI